MLSITGSRSTHIIDLALGERGERPLVTCEGPTPWGEGRCSWASTRDIRYGKVAGNWFIGHQRFDFLYFTPYESGW